MTECPCEASGALGTDGSATVLDIAEVGAGNAKAFGKDGETLGISFTNGGKSAAQRERAPHDFLEKCLSVVADAFFSSSHDSSSRTEAVYPNRGYSQVG